MTVVEAQAAVVTGASFGDVFGLLEDDADRDALRAWFVRCKDVPRHPRRPAGANGHAKPASTPTGNPCPECGGVNLVRTGSCVTCQDCGFNSGCS